MLEFRSFAKNLTPVGLFIAFIAGPATASEAEPILPIPGVSFLNAEKIALGKKLFNEPRLSRDQFVSCAFCHPLERYGADGLEISLGVDNAPTEFNTPTVFNVRFNVAQFWDGRTATLEDQIDDPLTGKNEMASNWEHVLDLLGGDKDYTSAFIEIYGGPPTIGSVKDAIATFERSLVTPDGAFDRYLKGEKRALTKNQVEGYQMFKSYGCSGCHFGVGVGGGIFSTVGAYFDPPPVGAAVKAADLGRFNVTGHDEDRFVFKVPSLRNVAETAPYFHDGSIPTLAEAVARMAYYQQGTEAPPEDIAKIVDFLTTLTGPLPESLGE